MKFWEKLRLWHRAWRYVYKTEKHEIALVRGLIEPGSFVIDIGAHKAAFTYWMAQTAGRRGKVLACEPNPDLAAYLRGVAGWFAKGQIEVLDAALSDENTSRKLHFPGRQLGMASLEIAQDTLRPPIEVQTYRLDDYLQLAGWRQPVTLIKCDVEHHELAVFRGAEGTLRRQRPILLFESGNLRTGGEVCRPVFQFLQSLGYEGHFFQDDVLVPLAEYDPQRHVVSELNQNFVFTHPAALLWESMQRPYRVVRLNAAQRQAA